MDDAVSCVGHIIFSSAILALKNGIPNKPDESIRELLGVALACRLWSKQSHVPLHSDCANLEIVSSNLLAPLDKHGELGALYNFANGRRDHASRNETNLAQVGI